jgi:hypothetical protein
MVVDGVILDERLEKLYRHWRGKCGGRAMPSRADIDPLEIPGEIWPYTMLLDVVWQGARPRFRYRRVGEIFWRDGLEPTGKYIEEAIPRRLGYRDYVIGIYEEMALTGKPLYTENSFVLEGRAEPMLVKRVSLPLSGDGTRVNMALAGHVFEHGDLPRDVAFSLVRELKELERIVLA